MFGDKRLALSALEQISELFRQPTQKEEAAHRLDEEMTSLFPNTKRVSLFPPSMNTESLHVAMTNTKRNINAKSQKFRTKAYRAASALLAVVSVAKAPKAQYVSTAECAKRNSASSRASRAGHVDAARGRLGSRPGSGSTHWPSTKEGGPRRRLIVWTRTRSCSRCRARSRRPRTW